MKRFNTCIVCMLLLFPMIFSIVSASESPKSAPILLNYQGILNDTAGNPMPGTYDMIFRMYTQETGGNYDWEELHAVGNAVTVDAAGVFNVILNNTGSASGNLANLLRDETVLWLEINVQGETLVPRQRITSSGYALTAPWSGITGIPADFSDGSDDIGFPGIGLDESGGSFTIEPSYRLPQTATNGQVAKWNSATSQWEAAEDQTGATYSAGDGLTLTGSVFAVDFAGSGSSSTVSRSDHNHMGSTWSGFVTPGLDITTSSTTSGATAIKGTATGNTESNGVHGETTSTTSGSSGVSGIASGNSGNVYGVRGETQSSSSGACGVSGLATGGGFSATGVYGETNATDGAGVYGKCGSTTGFGVYSEGHSKISGNLTVTGDVIVNGNIVNDPPETGYVSITSSAFRPEKYDMQYEGDGLKFLRLNGGLRIDHDKEGLADVQLPHGATITRVRVFGYTDSPLVNDLYEEYNVTLYRTAFDGTATIVCRLMDEDFPPVSGDSNFVYNSTSITTPVVDNSNYGYFLRFSTYINGELYGVIIDYEY